MTLAKTLARIGTGLLVIALQLAGSTPAGAAEPEVGASPAPRITADVVYGHKEGMALFYDVFRPARPNGAAVAFMISGGWFSRWEAPESRIDGFRGMLDRGFTVFAVHHGSAPRFKVPEAVADVRQAVRHIRLHAQTFGIDPERIGVAGGSAGGHLALMLGTASDAGDPAASDAVLRASDRVQAVVALYPPVDLRPLIGPSERFPALDFPKEQADQISPILFVSKDDPPTLLIHGDKDELVPLRNSTAMLAALEKVSVRSQLIVIEGGEHGFRSNPEHRQRAGAAMADWFDEHLGATKSAAAR